jgi:hypothetical protein
MMRASRIDSPARTSFTLPLQGRVGTGALRKNPARGRFKAEVGALAVPSKLDLEH